MSDLNKLVAGRKYKTKVVAELIEVSPARIGQICKTFELDIERTKGSNGHRLFTKTDAEIILGIRNKYQDGWDADQIKSWLKGEGPETFVSYQPKAAIELENEELKKENKELREALMVVNELKKKFPDGIEAYIEQQLDLKVEEKKDYFVTSAIREMQELKKQQLLEEYEQNKNKKPQGVFSMLINKLFSK